MQQADPVSRRMYLTHCLADAQNACEVQACTSAINVLEDEFPFLKKTVYNKAEAEEDLTEFRF